MPMRYFIDQIIVLLFQHKIRESNHDNDNDQ